MLTSIVEAEHVAAVAMNRMAFRQEILTTLTTPALPPKAKADLERLEKKIFKGDYDETDMKELQLEINDLITADSAESDEEDEEAFAADSEESEEEIPADPVSDAVDVDMDVAEDERLAIDEGESQQLFSQQVISLQKIFSVNIIIRKSW